MLLKSSYGQPSELRVIQPKPDLQDDLIIGVGQKPSGCATCAYREIGIGFVPDDMPTSPKIAILLEAPGETETIECRPLAGRAGGLWTYRLIIQQGYKRKDVLICNTLRCRPPENKYPTAKLRQAAESHCRAFDGKLLTFDPTLFYVTIHPGMLLRSTAMMRIVQNDMRNVFRFAEQGERPLVLMGDKAMHLVAPWLQGGVKGWRGNYWYGKYGTKFDAA